MKKEKKKENEKENKCVRKKVMEGRSERKNHGEEIRKIKRLKGTGEISLSRELHHIRKLHLLFYFLYNYCNFHKSHIDRMRKFIGQLVRR